MKREQPKLKTVLGEVAGRSIPHLVSQSAVAEMLGLKPRTMEMWRFKGIGPRYMKFGKTVRYSIDDVVNWLEAI